MCKIEHGFSNFKKLGFVKKGHVVSIAVMDEHRRKGFGSILVDEAIKGAKRPIQNQNTRMTIISALSAVDAVVKLLSAGDEIISFKSMEGTYKRIYTRC